MSARFIVGDVFDVLASLEPASVDLVMTSPPFLALRSYLPADHPDKGKEIGSEATPADFLDTLLDVVEALDRVLAPHGSIVVELGDTYAGSGGAGGDYAEGGLRDGQEKFDGSARRTGGRVQYEGQASIPGRKHYTVAKSGSAWPLDKSLCGIPTLFAWSLAYGRNLLRPERTTPQWRIRNVVAWCRPNPPVGALGDKVRPATSYLTIATKARNRYFDLDAVRTAHKADPTKYTGNGYSKNHPEGIPGNEVMPGNPAGAPPLDYWVIPTQPYSESHYATFPEKLCEIPIKSMCPLKVCTVCGEPSRRIVEVLGYTDHNGVLHPHGEKWASGLVDGAGAHSNKPGSRTTTTTTTTGWTDCGHNAWRTGVVLDPFGGSGTTGAVATGHGRNAVLIDLDERNAELALGRVGPLMLTVEHHDSRKGAA